jgi:hypothetical protein
MPSTTSIAISVTIAAHPSGVAKKARLRSGTGHLLINCVGIGNGRRTLTPTEGFTRETSALPICWVDRHEEIGALHHRRLPHVILMPRLRLLSRLDRRVPSAPAAAMVGRIGSLLAPYSERTGVPV